MGCFFSRSVDEDAGRSLAKEEVEDEQCQCCLPKITQVESRLVTLENELTKFDEDLSAVEEHVSTFDVDDINGRLDAIVKVQMKLRKEVLERDQELEKKMEDLLSLLKNAEE